MIRVKKEPDRCLLVSKSNEVSKTEEEELVVFFFFNSFVLEAGKEEVIDFPEKRER